MVFKMFNTDYMFNKTEILDLSKNEFKLESIKGNIPAKWPENLKEFIAELKVLPIIAFYNESESIIQ
jgi:hypothetical protein